MSADLIARLIEAGTPAALVAEVAMLAARAEQSSGADPVAARRRAWDREYRAEKRARDRVESGGSGGCRVDNADKVDTSPSLDKESFPPTPFKEINLTPCVITACEREAEPGFSALARLTAAQIAIELLVASLRHRKWKDMPPPPSVDDDLWRTFVDYRRAKRQTLTVGAYRPLAKNLAAFANDEWPPGRIVEEIMDRGWLTFKPEWLNRNTEIRNGQRTHHDRPSAWAPRPGYEGVEPASLDD